MAVSKYTTKHYKENTKLARTEHRRKQEKEAGQRWASYTTNRKGGLGDGLTRFKRTNF